jgi:hypothetical protein
MVWVRIKSHRALASAKKQGLNVSCYYNVSMNGEYIYSLPDEQIESALKIKGINRARVNPDDYALCWTTKDAIND